MGCVDDSISSSVNLDAMALIFSFIPSGGSITIFKAFCNMPRGNASVGLVVNQSLKFLFTLTFFGKPSNIFSKFTSQSGRRSQFYNIAQLPLYAKLIISSSAS